MVFKRARRNRRLPELLSDYFREASVLVLVFGLLEPAFKGDDTPRSWWYYLGIWGLGIGTFLVGIFFEGRRR